MRSSHTWSVLAALALVAALIVPVLYAQEAAAPAPAADEPAETKPLPDERAMVEAALDWLAEHQENDGHWDADGYTGRCPEDDLCAGPGGWMDRGEGHPDADVGATGMATLAFLWSGNTQEAGRKPSYYRAVRKALRYLKTHQRPDGSIGFSNDLGSFSIYNHGWAALAFCEAYAMTHDNTLRNTCRSAVEFIFQAQNMVPGKPDTAMGWRYGIRSGQNDTAVTTLMLTVLAKAKGLDFMSGAQAASAEQWQAAWEGAGRWLDQVYNPETGKSGYISPNGKSSMIPRPPSEEQQTPEWSDLPTCTAMATWARTLLGQQAHDEQVVAGVGNLVANLPQADEERRQVDYWYWLFGTRAMFYATGPQIHEWDRALLPALVDLQCTEGHRAGSWDPTDAWGLVGGRVYSTACGVLTLQALHRTVGKRR